MRSLARFFLLALLCTLPRVEAAEAPPVEIKIGVAPGLKFDLPRFAIAPGARVTVKFTNPDQMIHNFVITAPGARTEVVTAALALGAEGPAKNFIPDSPQVLWHTNALNPGEKAELTFTAPATEAVYPYVCTSMGHGFVMYGAMYVTAKPLPPLESDPNVPPSLATVSDASDLSHTTLDRIVVSRTFLPDCGPAALAVGLPGGQAYCFDAGLCRLRYAWKGGYVDNAEHWAGKGEAQAQVVGRVYYRAPEQPVLRIGKLETLPAARWKGYSWKEGQPTFHYTLDGCAVQETPAPLASPSQGMSFTYEIASQGAPVFLVTDPEGGATFTSSAGTWQAGTLTLSAAEAAHFTLTMTERPGREPLRYWSMNDALLPGKKSPPLGVLSNAFAPGGEGKKPKAVGTGISTDVLKQGATLAAWVKIDPAKPTAKKAEGADVQPVFGAGDTFVIAAPASDEQWHHLAVTLTENGAATLYLNGKAQGPLALHLPAQEVEITLGSIGEKTFLHGLLDEVRIYDRVLPGEEIERLYRRESQGLALP